MRMAGRCNKKSEIIFDYCIHSNMQDMLSYRTLVVAVGDTITLIMKPFLTIKLPQEIYLLKSVLTTINDC